MKLDVLSRLNSTIFSDSTPKFPTCIKVLQWKLKIPTIYSRIGLSAFTFSRIFCDLQSINFDNLYPEQTFDCVTSECSNIFCLVWIFFYCSSQPRFFLSTLCLTITKHSLRYLKLSTFPEMITFCPKNVVVIPLGYVSKIWNTYFILKFRPCFVILSISFYLSFLFSLLLNIMKFKHSMFCRVAALHRTKATLKEMVL